jgi:hypothetical protein
MSEGGVLTVIAVAFVSDAILSSGIHDPGVVKK